MKIILSNNIKLIDPPVSLKNKLMRRLTFVNPKWVENEKMGRYNKKTPYHLKFYKKDRDTLIIPRGFINNLIELGQENVITIIEQRARLPLSDFQFNGNLKPFQKEATAKMLEEDFGVLNAPTGSGKTVMALYMISERKQPTLIIVHTKELAYQWKHRIKRFLIPDNIKIGMIGDKKFHIGDITIALIQSLYKCADEVNKFGIGYLIVDECHRIPSRTFTQAVSKFNSRYMTGLSATPWRRDGLSKLIYWHMGDIVHEIKKEDLIESGDILKYEVIKRNTNFYPFSDPVYEYSKMISELAKDKDRNEMIACDVKHELKENNSICIVLTDRKYHCDLIQEILSNQFNIQSTKLTGDIPKQKRAEIIDRLNKGDVKVLLATGQLIGEGFDCKHLSALFMATPIKYTGRLLQYLGRVLRPAPNKTCARIYDYIDVNVGVLIGAAKTREKIYNK